MAIGAMPGVTAVRILPVLSPLELAPRASPATIYQFGRLALSAGRLLSFGLESASQASPVDESHASVDRGIWRAFVFRAGPRGAPPRSRVQSAYDLFSYAAAAYVSESLLGAEASPSILTRLFDTKARIEDALDRAYSVPEQTAGATGGAPGLKEILLYALIRRLRPSTVLETGVAQGVSSTFILQALEDNRFGSLISIDLPRTSAPGLRYSMDPSLVDNAYVKAGLETGWLVPEVLRNRWTLHLGSSAAILPELGNLGIDLFFHDSEHSYGNMRMEYGWALNHLRPLGILVSDDVTWNEAFSDLLMEHQGILRPIVRSPVGVCQVYSQDRASEAQLT